MRPKTLNEKSHHTLTFTKDFTARTTFLFPDKFHTHRFNWWRIVSWLVSTFCRFRDSCGLPYFPHWVDHRFRGVWWIFDTIVCSMLVQRMNFRIIIMKSFMCNRNKSKTIRRKIFLWYYLAKDKHHYSVR